MFQAEEEDADGLKEGHDVDAEISSQQNPFHRTKQCRYGHRQDQCLIRHIDTLFVFVDPVAQGKKRKTFDQEIPIVIIRDFDPAQMHALGYDDVCDDPPTECRHTRFYMPCISRSAQRTHNHTGTQRETTSAVQ